MVVAVQLVMLGGKFTDGLLGLNYYSSIFQFLLWHRNSCVVGAGKSGEFEVKKYDNTGFEVRIKF
jgi:hypothetical protein